ncbi:cytochrome c oxidase assembly protein [Brevundimonas guildfordensis]|uniref:Cytochrome c oxidase assembly protein n=1 Tax=Brevundimonas guildfordensis TaxID=2762241 RepID=A0ABR8QWW1_9CAUL|nr:cytochrome c oxidase assembly protein [Brevundimonas guildfordensis]MBD7940025.1 cytochrome c oxidase assembly protein [Brevundimonas guildfordensis]
MVDTVWTPYCGPAPAPAEALGRWNGDPALWTVLAAAALAGLVLLRGPARGRYAAAMAVLAVGFVSPLCALSSALFAARTLHHLLLVLAAAPLLALCVARLRRPRLAAATAMQAVVFWAWHAPDLYAQALSHDAVYWLMQVSILGSAVWFWAAVRSARGHAAVAALLAAMLLMGLLGALIVFAGQPLYAPHFASTMAWGVTPMDDQQAAGLIMWAPAAAAYLLVALWRLNGLLKPTDRPAGGAAA